MIKLIYEKGLGDYVSSLKLDERGEVIAANMASGCFYLIDLRRKEVFKYCYGVSYDISYLNNTFSFVTFNGLVYVISSDGELINVFQVDSEYSNAIALTKEGIVVCNTKCALYDFEGRRLWSIRLKGYVRPGMKGSGNAVYAIVEQGEESRVIKISLEGEAEEVFDLSESIFSIDACGEAIAVGSYSSLIVLGSESWSVEGFEGVSAMRFSKDCEKIMVADMYNKAVTLFKVGAGEEIEIIEDGLVTSMDWRGVLAIGLNDGRIKVYEIER